MKDKQQKEPQLRGSSYVTGQTEPDEKRRSFFVPKTRRTSKTERRFARLSADAPRPLAKGEGERYDGLNYNRKKGSL